MKIVPLVEQGIIKILYFNLDLLDTDYYQYFISDIGKALFKALTSIQETNMTPSKRSLFVKGLKYYDKLQSNHIDFIDEDYELGNLPEYLKELKDQKVIDSLQNEKLEDLTVEATKKKLDLDILEGKLEAMVADIHKLKSEEEEVEFYTSEEETKKFKDIIEERKLGKSFPSGDSYLDDYLYNRSLMPEEMSVVFGLSGSGKSTYARNLIERRRLKSLPTLDIALEMSLESALDAKHAIRTKLDRSEFTFSISEEEELLDMKASKVDKALNEEFSKSKKYNNYLHLNLDSMSINELKQYVIKAKKLMGLEPEEYLFVCVDLMSQMKEFNVGKGSKADNYEEALNMIHALVKELKIHVMGLFQPRRESTKIVINCIEDVYKYKPNTEQLKNSGAIEERSRVIISIFRPMHLLKKYCSDAPELDYMEDVLEAQILKQNNFQLSPPIYYLFNPENGILYQYRDYDPELAFASEEEDDEE